jgi:hypothetical protein
VTENHGVAGSIPALGTHKPGILIRLDPIDRGFSLCAAYRSVSAARLSSGTAASRLERDRS